MPSIKTTLEYSGGSGEVSQTIDLEALTGVDVSIDPTLTREIGQAIIDYMTARADSGKEIGGVKLKSPYSESYADSLNFKAAGKSKSNVNMQLSGDMLGGIDIVSEEGSEIKIAVASEDAPKAYNHQTGDTVPKRPFFGINAKEFKDYILPQFKMKLKEIKSEGAAGALQALTIREIMGTSNEVIRESVLSSKMNAQDLFDEVL